MRGTAGSRQDLNNAPGITPAHAGNSFGRAALVPHGKDHPRSCGEQNEENPNVPA